MQLLLTLLLTLGLAASTAAEKTWSSWSDSTTQTIYYRAIWVEPIETPPPPVVHLAAVPKHRPVKWDAPRLKHPAIRPIPTKPTGYSPGPLGESLKRVDDILSGRRPKTLTTLF